MSFRNGTNLVLRKFPGKTSENMKIVEFPRSQPFSRKFRRRIKLNGNSRNVRKFGNITRGCPFFRKFRKMLSVPFVTRNFRKFRPEFSIEWKVPQGFSKAEGRVSFVGVKRLGWPLNNGNRFSKISKPTQWDGAYICDSISRNCFQLLRDWKLENAANSKRNFRRSVPKGKRGSP